MQRRRYLALGVMVVAAGASGAFLRLQPSHDRDWRQEQALLPSVTITDSLVTIRNVRNFRYGPAGEQMPAYDDRVYDLSKLETAWYVLSPFAPGWRGPAHSFVSFGFADSQFVSISVEARRPAGADYSVWKGALRQYELMYVIGDERDLIGLRAIHWDDPTFVYPIRATSERTREVFLAMLARAQEIERRPEFYNTVSNNCTTNILDAVNLFAEKPIRHGYKILFPGYSDELAYDLELIDTDLDLAAAREHFLINGRAQAAAQAPDFSQRIRSPAGEPVGVSMK
jgi:hypothetical protein